MRQKFILEKEDIETLRNGGTINLAFAGGKIELGAEAGRKQLIGYEGRKENEAKKESIHDYLNHKKVPASAKEIGTALGIRNQDVHSALSKLKKQKRVVGSDNGWRIVHEAAIVKPIRPALVHSNGYSKVKSNGR